MIGPINHVPNSSYTERTVSSVSELSAVTRGITPNRLTSSCGTFNRSSLATRVLPNKASMLSANVRIEFFFTYRLHRARNLCGDLSLPV